MPTICKIFLDASEYRKELQDVLNESRAATRTITENSGSISISADTDNADKEIAGVKQKLDAIPAEKNTTINVTGNSAGELEHLENQMQQTQSGAGKFGAAFRNLLPQGFGAEIGKGATLIGALGTAAGASVPPVSLLAAAVNALLSPIALIVAAFSALVAIGMKVWDNLTVSADKYAAKTKAASEEAQRLTEKIKVQEQAAAGYLTRLQEITAAERRKL